MISYYLWPNEDAMLEAIKKWHGFDEDEEISVEDRSTVIKFLEDRNVFCHKYEDANPDDEYIADIIKRIDDTMIGLDSELSMTLSPERHGYMGLSPMNFIRIAQDEIREYLSENDYKNYHDYQREIYGP